VDNNNNNNNKAGKFALMSKHSSFEVKKRIVAFVYEGGSKVEAARRFRVSRSTVYRCLEAHDAGTLDPRTRTNAKRRLDPEQLKWELARNPGATLKELGKIFGVNYVTVWYAMKRMKIKVKRAHSARKRRKRVATKTR